MTDPKYIVGKHIDEIIDLLKNGDYLAQFRIKSINGTPMIGIKDVNMERYNLTVLDSIVVDVEFG